MNNYRLCTDFELNKIEKGIRSPKLIISRIELNNHVIKLVKGNNNFGSQNNKLSFILLGFVLKMT